MKQKVGGAATLVFDLVNTQFETQPFCLYMISLKPARIKGLFVIWKIFVSSQII